MEPDAAFPGLDIAACTHVGRREHNEDSHLIDRALGLVIVADGVGGHQSGEVASAITCEVIHREVAAGATLRNAILYASFAVLDAALSGKGRPGMASTVVAARLQADHYELAWVGDSRGYLFDGRLHLLSRDHSLVEQQVARGEITREQARSHPQRHVILQAIGAPTGKPEVGYQRGPLAPGACLLLCTDGLTDPLDAPRLCELLGHRSSAGETCHRLVDAAYEAGGRDNITALMVVRAGDARAARGHRSASSEVWVYNPSTSRYESGQIGCEARIARRARNLGAISAGWCVSGLPAPRPDSQGA